MTDLEITRLCAEAMLDGPGYFEFGRNYDPLHDDAQAMALVKKFGLQLSQHLYGKVWLAAFPFAKQSDFVGHHTENADVNRAICECVAKMQAQKPKGAV